MAVMNIIFIFFIYLAVSEVFSEKIDVKLIGTHQAPSFDKHQVNDQSLKYGAPDSYDHRYKYEVENDEPLLNKFPSYEEIRSYLTNLEKNHTDTVKLFSIGKSSENRDILIVKISKGGSKKPALLIDAGIHAREWIAPTTALYAIKQLVENSSENSTNSYIFDNVNIYVIPLLNPDGYEYTRESPETRLWRKTRSQSQYSDCYGVDLNRNFYEWTTVGISSDPCSPTYGGPNPFSEPESRALRDFILNCQDHLKVYLSLHSYGQYFLHPWGHSPGASENKQMLKCVAEKAESELAKIRGTRYRIASVSDTFRPTAGGSIDWAMKVVDLAYAIELPPYAPGYWIEDKFIISASEIEPVGRETFEAFKVFVRYVAGEAFSCSSEPIVDTGNWFYTQFQRK